MTNPSWDPSWSGTRCPACGHLHPTTAERVTTFSTTCDACGAPMRTLAGEGAPEPPRAEGCTCQWLNGPDLQGWVTDGCILHDRRRALGTIFDQENL